MSIYTAAEYQPSKRSVITVQQMIVINAFTENWQGKNHLTIFKAEIRLYFTICMRIL